MRNLARCLLVAVVSFGVFAIAEATPVAAIVVTDATTSLQNQIPSMTAVLTTVLGLTALVMAFSWIRRVMK